MKIVSVLLLLGLGVLLSPAVAADEPPDQNAKPKPAWIGGQNDPFIQFSKSLPRLKVYLDVYDKLPLTASDKQRQIAMLETRGAAVALARSKVDFAFFFSKGNMPPAALAIAKPLFEALKDPIFQKKNDALPLAFDIAEINQLHALYALYSTLPFPTADQLKSYIAAWPSTASEKNQASTNK